MRRKITMKKYDYIRETIDAMTECAEQSIRNMNKRRAGCACCVFTAVSTETNKHAKESDGRMVEILTIIGNKLKKRGYSTVIYQGNKDGSFLFYIAKEWFYIESIKTLHDMKPKISKVAFWCLLGKVLGLSDEEIERELSDIGEDNNEEE